MNNFLGGNSNYDVKASPLVNAVQNAGFPVILSITNFVVMIAILSAGNCSIYGTSRTLAALTGFSQAPKVFSYIDNNGFTLIAFVCSSLFGLLSYIVCAGQETIGKPSHG